MLHKETTKVPRSNSQTFGELIDVAVIQRTFQNQPECAADHRRTT
jgi:hypothetical protein